jgi:hypothetical protein
MAGLKKHGITANTPSELMFRAATIYKNLKFASNAWTGDVLGATSGGSKFSLVEEFADAEVDGALVKFKGGKVKIGETGTLEVNMTEFKEDVIKTALHLVEDTKTTVAGYKVYKTKGSVAATDYLDNIAVVGELTSGKNIIFILPNAFCTSGIEVEPKDKEQATYTLTFEAHADITGDLDHLPVEIYYPQATTTGA